MPTKIQSHFPVIFGSTHTDNIYLTLIQFNHSPQSAQLPSYARNQLRSSSHFCNFFIHIMFDLMAFMRFGKSSIKSISLSPSLFLSVSVCICLCVVILFYSIIFPYVLWLAEIIIWQAKRNGTICKTTCAVVRTLLKVLSICKNSDTEETQHFCAPLVFDISLLFMCCVQCTFSTNFCYVFLVDGDCLFNIKFSTKSC